MRLIDQERSILNQAFKRWKGAPVPKDVQFSICLMGKPYNNALNWLKWASEPPANKLQLDSKELFSNKAFNWLMLETF